MRLQHLRSFFGLHLGLEVFQPCRTAGIENFRNVDAGLGESLDDGRFVHIHSVGSLVVVRLADRTNNNGSSLVGRPGHDVVIAGVERPDHVIPQKADPEFVDVADEDALEDGHLDWDHHGDLTLEELRRLWAEVKKGGDAEYEAGDDENQREKSVETIQRLTSRLSAVTRRNVENLRSTERLDVGPVDVITDVQVVCEDCGRQYDAVDLVEQGACQCREE
jgi:hypothetical protein